MEIFQYIFYIGVVNIIFTSIWKLIALFFSSALLEIGINKDASFLFFKTLGYYIFVSLTALLTVQFMNPTYNLAALAYAIVGTFVVYATIAGNLERNRWRAVMNFERKRIRVMRYDGYLLMSCIVLFIITIIKPGIAHLPPLQWILSTIDDIYRTPVLKFIIGFFAFFYMLNILFRGFRASDAVFNQLFNRKKPSGETGDTYGETEFTDYEEIPDDEK